MDFIRRQPILGAVLGFVVGLIIGLPILGWGLLPVKWTNAGPQDLTETTRTAYIMAAADSYSSRLDVNRAKESFVIWPDAPQEICRLSQASTDPADQQRLVALAAAITDGVGCAQFAGQPIPVVGEEEGLRYFNFGE